MHSNQQRRKKSRLQQSSTKKINKKSSLNSYLLRGEKSASVHVKAFNSRACIGCASKLDDRFVSFFHFSNVNRNIVVAAYPSRNNSSSAFFLTFPLSFRFNFFFFFSSYLPPLSYPILPLLSPSNRKKVHDDTKKKNRKWVIVKNVTGKKSMEKRFDSVFCIYTVTYLQLNFFFNNREHFLQVSPTVTYTSRA